MNDNPFMRFNGGPEQNPFAHNVMLFSMSAISDINGSVREMLISIPMPSTATELEARRKLLDLAHKAGWRLRNIERVDNHNRPTQLQ